jgi:hypothetical protein
VRPEKRLDSFKAMVARDSLKVDGIGVWCHWKGNRSWGFDDFPVVGGILIEGDGNELWYERYSNDASASSISADQLDNPGA